MKDRLAYTAAETQIHTGEIFKAFSGFTTKDMEILLGRSLEGLSMKFINDYPRVLEFRYGTLFMGFMGDLARIRASHATKGWVQMDVRHQLKQGDTRDFRVRYDPSADEQAYVPKLICIKPKLGEFALSYTGREGSATNKSIFDSTNEDLINFSIGSKLQLNAPANQKNGNESKLPFHLGYEGKNLIIFGQSTGRFCFQQFHLILPYRIGMDQSAFNQALHYSQSLQPRH